MIAASAVVVLAVTSFVVWGVPALHAGANGRIYSNQDWDYDYTDPMLGLEPDHEFEFPATYDLDALAKRQAKSSSKSTESRPTDFAFQVYYDAAFTKRAEMMAIQYKPNQPVHISAADSSSASSADLLGDSVDIKDKRAGYTWGLHSEYYLMRKVDENGKKLAKPVVTKFTVKSALDAPVVTFSSKKNDGSLTMSWKAIPGAKHYIVVASKADVDGDTVRDYQVLGETKRTTWSSASSTEKTGDDRAPWLDVQNVNMQMYDGSSADDLSLGWVYDTHQAEYDYGVIATSGKSYSPYNSYDALQVAGTLPHELAYGASHSLKHWGDSGYVEGVDNIQKTIAFTSLDGTTRATAAFITADHVLDYGDRWILPLEGRGTRLGEWVPVLKSSVPDLAATIAQYNATAEAASPSTGLTTFANVSAPVDELTKAVKKAPATDYPIYGTNPFSKFLAQHFLAQTPVIDISDYVGKPGMPEAMDAASEAMYQNPYAINVDGLSIGGDGKKLYVTYLFGKDEAQRLQAAIAAKSKAVITEVITDGMSDAEKVTALNNWLVAHSEYDDAAAAALDQSLGGVPEGYEDAWNASGVLIDGKGVCASYAYAFNALANEAGIETVVVAGNVLAGGAHAWNKVKISGEWKAVDVTWDDSSEGNRYLLIKDSQFDGTATRTEDDRWIADLYLSRYATK